MKSDIAHIDTALSVPQCEAVFRAAAAGPIIGKGFIARRFAKMPPATFFVPNRTDLSVAAGGEPNFELGCALALPMESEAAIHLYVWDRGSKRQVQLVAPYSAGGGGGASRLLKRFAERFAAEDRSAKIH